HIYTLSLHDALPISDIIETMFEYRGHAIAWFITEKLYRFFVNNDSQTDEAHAIIEKLATAFQIDWELKPLLNTLLTSEHFFDPRSEEHTSELQSQSK